MITIYTADLDNIPTELKEIVKKSNGKISLVQSDNKNQTEIVITHFGNERENFFNRLLATKSSTQGSLLFNLLVAKIIN